MTDYEQKLHKYKQKNEYLQHGGGRDEIYERINAERTSLDDNTAAQNVQYLVVRDICEKIKVLLSKSPLDIKHKTSKYNLPYIFENVYSSIIGEHEFQIALKKSYSLSIPTPRIHMQLDDVLSRNQARQDATLTMKHALENASLHKSSNMLKTFQQEMTKIIPDLDQTHSFVVDQLKIEFEKLITEFEKLKIFYTIYEQLVYNIEILRDELTDFL